MRAAVVGGGLGGCAAAIALRSVGWEATVFESSPAIRREGESISLWSNGTAALARIGVGDPPGQTIETLRLEDGRGRRLAEADVASLSARLGHPNVTVPREELLDRLVARLDGGVRYAKRAVGAVTDGSLARVSFADGTTVEADLVVAADGVNSALRSALWPGDSPVFLGVGDWQGTAERPPALGPPTRVVCTVAGGTFAGAFPTTDDRVHWFIDERVASPSIERASMGESLAERVRAWPPPLPELVAATDPVNLRFYPVFARRPLRDWVKGRVVLLGDAAHAMAPALGQGASQAFADAVVLARAVSGGARTIDEGLRDYSRRRSRVARGYWRTSRASLAVRRTPVFSGGLRWAPDRLATAVFGELVRPERSLRWST